jgi:type II secretory pathway component PulF
MKNDEFAFLNQQLAAMLRDGIPLEGALKRLCADMKRGTLRSELEKLEADLSKGTPLTAALGGRQLPDLYKRLLLVGARSNDMPGVLNLLADYYQQQHNLWTLLKGLWCIRRLCSSPPSSCP